MKWINDRYKIIKKLPGGNLSKVYYCLDHGDNEPTEVVIKTFNYADSENGVLHTKLFFREIEILQTLDHPNIVKLLDKGKDDEHKIYYIVMEYFESQTLDKVIVDDMLSDKQKFFVLGQMIDALVYAHSKQVIHRDLKPSNILINELNEIRIIDFGTSKIKNNLHNEYTVSNFATPKYASWEQKAFKTIDHRTDIYSLGIIMFELFTGSILKDDSDLQRAIKEHEGLKSNIKTLLLKMTETEPDNRYGSMAEVRFALREAMKDIVRDSCYGISFTKSAMANLHKLGFIQNATNRSEAAKVIYQDLSKSQTYMEFDQGSNQNQPTYKLYGKQLEYRCAVDKLTGKTLTIIGVHYRNAAAHEAKKERAVPVVGEWDVCQVIHEGSMFDDIQELIRYVDEQKQQKIIREKREVSEKNSIERWQKVLRMYSESLEERRNTLRYVGFEQDAFGERIWVKLLQPVEEVVFTDDQLLRMTSRQSINRTKPAGYCVDIEGDCLVIQLAKGASPDDFAQSGEISIDQSAVETSINRQKRALKAVQFKELQNNNLADILFDSSKAQSSPLVQEIRFHSELDPSKKEAIEKALAAKDLFLLQGPPGTGKTTFIGELVYQIIKANPDSKILISSQSNVAVDHALNKIRSILPSALILRIGRKDKLSLGAERFTIEEQLDSWFEQIKTSCESFLEKYKNNVGLNDDLAKQHQITIEIDNIERRLEEIHQLQIENGQKSMKLKERYDALKKLVNEIQRSAAEIQNKAERVNETSLRSIIAEFQDRMLTVSDAFVNKLVKTLDLALQKDELEEQAENLKTEETQLLSKLSELKRLIGVENAEELHLFKKELEQQLIRHREHYERIAKIEKIQQEWISRLGTDDKLTDVLVRRANIIGATCLGVANLSSVNQVVFDWVIIDEAGRATPPELLVPMTLGKKVVLVGDHKQLPPLVDQEIQKLDLKGQDVHVKDLEISLFEELMTNINPECAGALKEQYRMHPAIGNLVSKAFYDGDLVSKTSAEDRSHGFSRWENRGVVWLSTADHPERFEQVIRLSQSHNTYLNRLEARIIFETLVLMDQEYASKQIRKEVGIIAGYQAQKTDLRKLLETEYKDRFRCLDVEINTVDAFQGRETDIIFYSVVRSNKEGKVGFLSDARRLNVALSRARELLVIVGDHIAVTQEKYVNREQINPFVKVIEYIESNPDLCVLERVEKQ